MILYRFMRVSVRKLGLVSQHTDWRYFNVAVEENSGVSGVWSGALLLGNWLNSPLRCFEESIEYHVSRLTLQING